MVRHIAMLLGTAGMLAAPAAAAEIQVSATGPVVELTVFESVEAEPDIARVSAGVTTQAATAVQAMRDNAAAMAQVVERITRLGIAERDVQTSGISLGAQYDYDQANQRQVFRGYQASNRVSVTLRQIDRTGPVLDALVAAGATDLGGPEWALEDDKAARSEARRAALETARSLAGDHAQAAGFRDLRLLEINETVASQVPMPMMRMVARDVAEAASTPVRPGMVQAGVTLTVKYEMTR